MLLISEQEILYFENFDLQNVVTPIDYHKLDNLLRESGYDPAKSRKLVDGFKNEFSIGYDGDTNVRLTAPNLPLTVGSEIDLWNKVMKEVKAKRYAGPFNNISYENNYIQSPIGLVPKDNGTDTRLIFHLSYPRSGNNNRSVNANTPRHLCQVSYRDFDMAVKRCLEEGIGCSLSKSDVKSAFRNLGILPKHWRYLIMKARNPRDGKIYYFVDKCLPFGALISCALFQAFSDALAHIVRWAAKCKKDIVNYLDDFLFLALLRAMCQQQLDTFMSICQEINLPISIDKTLMPTTRMVFLGLLIDTVKQLILLPKEKIIRGRQLVDDILCRKKVTVKQLQKLCGFLNFLGRAVVSLGGYTAT